MIEVDGLSVRRGATCVLHGITLRVGAEIVALAGPSGSGKTTLLRSIVGLERPTAGSVHIAGRLVSANGRVEVPTEERNVAFVFQDLALWPHLSVHDNLAFGLRARGVPKAQHAPAIARVLAEVGLETFGARAPGELSGGERQRVAVARALVLQPAAVLLDEPLGSLDVVCKAELLRLFARVFSERAIPVLYATHDPHEAAQLAHRVAIVEAGRVTQLGTVAELKAAPATPFVEAFVARLD